MERKKLLAFAIAKYLKNEMDSNTQEDESLEVAIQCLENAFGISLDDNTNDVGVSLLEMFDAYLCRKAPASDEVKANAEKWRVQGNDLMKTDKYQEAVDCYNKAIDLDDRNPVYFCNRAAAYSQLQNHTATINDCKSAIAIEPTYSKAYGRMGVAYSSLGMYQDAKNAYLKALELEPGNALHQKNMELNELKLKDSPAMSLGDFNSFLGNPNLASIASQMLTEPGIQNMLSTVMSGPGGTTPQVGMDGILMAGHRLAQMLQTSNPALVEQLRQSTARGGNPPPAP